MNSITATQHELNAALSIGHHPLHVRRMTMLRHTELFLASAWGRPDLRVVGHDRACWLAGCSWSSLRRYFSPNDMSVRYVNGETITIHRLDLYAMGAVPWSLAQAPPDRRMFKFRDIEKMFDSAD